jgi:hypothetical protein
LQPVECDIGYSGFAGESQKVIVPGDLASDAGETVVRIAAFDEAIDGLLLHLTLKAPGSAQLVRVATDALVQSARARIARPVDSAAWRNSVSTAHPASNAHAGAARAS